MIVILPGGFHPYHAGHFALYQSAKKAFPNAEVYVAATDDTSERPFPFELKEKLAKLAGVDAGHFIRVKSPFQAKEITQNYDPNQDVLVFVRSEKDRNEQPKPGGTKKDGSPAYFQPWTGEDLQPFSKHAYIAYLPTVKFGPGITSATEIRKAWPTLNDKQKLAMVMSLYPKAKENERLAQNVVSIFDQVMGNGIIEDKEHKDDLFIAGDPESEALLRFAQEHYPTATSKQQAFVKFVQRALKHSKDEDEQQDIQIAQLEKEIGILNSKLANNRPINEDSGNEIAQEVIEKLAPAMDNVHKEKVEDYTDEARKLILKTDNPTVREKLIQIFKKGKENPYLQGGIITTVGALLAGGVLNTSQSMGLSPGQTNMVLQAVLNTIIPALVSRVNGKNWEDTVKYTLASAGIGTGIAALTEDYLEEK